MKKLSKRQREMSRETLENNQTKISILKSGIAGRENGTIENNSDLADLRAKLEYLEAVNAQAIIICETDADMDIIAENTWR
jgi:hypothetical protein